VENCFGEAAETACLLWPIGPNRNTAYFKAPAQRIAQQAKMPREQFADLVAGNYGTVNAAFLRPAREGPCAKDRLA